MQRAQRRQRQVATEPEPAQNPQRNGQHLADGAGQQHYGGQRQQRDAGARPVGGQGPGHAPDGLGHHGDRDQLEAMQHALGQRPVKAGRRKGKGHQQHGRWQCEGRPGCQRAQRTGAPQAQRKADLARGRTGQELAERHEVCIGRLIEPLAAQHQFVAEIAQMGDGPAKGGEAQLEEGNKDLAGRPRQSG